MTFVLIIFTHVYYGDAVATIPGYESEAACVAAGAQFKTGAAKFAYNRDALNWICIKGPGER